MPPASVQDLCAVAPPPTQPLTKLDGIAKAGGGRRSATASELLQEKYNFKVRATTDAQGLFGLHPCAIIRGCMQGSHTG